MNKGYRIVVDAGHGGTDPGAVSGGLKEKDFNLEAANYMYRRFQELGVPVAITRDSDISLSRTDRLNKMTKTFGNDAKVIVLSNHINAGGGEGAEIAYPLRTSSVLPNAILNEIGSRGQIKRKIYQRTLPENSKKDYYYIMRETPNTTALLIEYGFIDNPRDQIKLQNNLLDYVEGVVKAVSEYIGIPYNEENSEIDGSTYTVKKGDNLYTIALKNNVTVDEIKRLNNLTNNGLKVGQVLIIPQKVIEEEYDIYTIKSGDTLYSISRENNISINDLIDYNNLDSTILTINQTIKIPKNKIIEEIVDDSNMYEVVSGDTLYSIANKYNTSVNEIKLLNNLDSNVLSIGQRIKIPTNIVNEKDFIVYEVVSGDTLYSIAKKYNTKVDSIKAYNNLESNLLSIGQVLQIPNEVVDTSYQIYNVESGDTLYSISRKYNKTVDELMNFNNLNSTILQIGQSIRIPL